jgi:hypothetical protein
MFTQNLFRIAAPVCFAVGVALGGPAEAGFDVSTSIFSVSGAKDVMAGGGVSTYSVDTAILTLTDFKTTGDTSTVTPAESIALTGTFDMGATIEVIENVFVTNPSLSGSFLTFQVVADFTLTSSGLIADSAGFHGSTITQQTLNGTTFTISNPQATTTAFGSGTNSLAITAVITPSSTVPEPSSLALSGMASAIGLAVGRARRRIGG